MKTIQAGVSDSTAEADLQSAEGDFLLDEAVSGASGQDVASARLKALTDALKAWQAGLVAGDDAAIASAEKDVGAAVSALPSC